LIAMTPLEAAIATGLPCFPCWGNSKAPTIPGPGGHKHATADPAELRALWRRHPGPLVGVRTGEASGRSVLDIDGPKHPEADVWLAAHRAQLPETRIHRTRSGGLHFVFQHVPGVRTSTGRPGRPARGVDARGEGGYVIWWPAAGCPVVCDAPLAPWPQWLSRVLWPPPAVAPRPPIHDAKGPLSPALRDRLLSPLKRAVSRTPEGQRHDVLFWAACRVGELITAGQIDSEWGAEQLARAAAGVGLPDIEARRTIADGFARTR
jgi:bifunctional DNA primase/polymerase-like protein